MGIYHHCDGRGRSHFRGLDEDGKAGVSDIVRLSKYLMRKATFKNWKTADLNGDNIVNVIDLALLKRKVLQS